MNSVLKKIGQILLFISTAEEIWNNLISRLKQDDAPRVYDLEQRLSKIEQVSLDVSTYYTELVTLWEEHKNYVELPVCTCGHCESDAAVLWEKLQQRSRVTKFLMSLNESYEQTRRHILMLKPILTIEEAFNIVTQDERQKSLRSSTKPDSMAFQALVLAASSDVMHSSANLMDENAYIAAYNTRGSYQKPVCTHCGKLGHTVQKCFKIHGFPPGYKTHGGGYKNQSTSKVQQSPSPQPRMQQTQIASHPTAAQQANAIANVHSDFGSAKYAYSQPPQPQVTSAGTSMTLQDFTPQQIQHLILQFNTQVRVQEPIIPSSRATITEHGVMATTSTSGMPFPSITLSQKTIPLPTKIIVFPLFKLYYPVMLGLWIVEPLAMSVLI